MTKCCDQECKDSKQDQTKLNVKTQTLPGLSFRILGMDCAEEIQILRKEIGPIVGGDDKLTFDLLNTKMSVHAETEASKIIEAVARTGMIAEPWVSEKERAKKSFLQTNIKNILTIISGVFVAAGFLSHVVSFGVLSAIGAKELVEGHKINFLSQVFYCFAILAGIRFVLPKAIFAIRKLRPDMNFLMTVAIVGAVFIGEWFEAATVAFLFSLSLTLESWSIGRARRAVAALMELAPSIVRIPEDKGEEKLVSPESVAIGTVFLVKPGDRFPLDGKVIRGESDVNQAPITGESMPIEKKKGDEVFAGTINGNGALYVESTKLANSTTLANIIRMVGEAQSRRAPSEQFVEKFAVVYTPLVMFLALIVFFVPPLFFAEVWADWFYKSLVLLVIACPCALVISTPVSIVAALTAAARAGILVKGGAFIETPSKLRVVAIDKTGTLTLGKPSIVNVIPSDGIDTSDLLKYSAALEMGSTHPIAVAIVEYSRKHHIPITMTDNYTIIPGKGVQGTIDGEKYWLGSHRFLEEMKIETKELHDEIIEKESQGHTVVVVGNRKQVLGYITLADAIRPEAKEAVQQLHLAGISSIVMLTGDNYQTAETIAKQTGIDQFFAELLPEDKVREIEKLVSKYKFVAMVGDGVNDAPAMGRASLGIAMGAVGSDVAIETADIALMSDDLSKLAWLIHHSKKTVAIIRQNISFSLSIKLLFVILTFAGHSSLWTAIAADMGASLLVIFNALRLLRL